jgi:hypothetical protein
MESPLEQFDHQHHAAHAAGQPVTAKVAMTIAVLAVGAAGVGSLETLESGAATAAKNEAVLLQNKATDQWNFFQARSIKRNIYEIAAAAGGAKTEDYKARVAEYTMQSDEIQTKARQLEATSDEALHRGYRHEERHHRLTVAATLLHIAIAVATITIIAGGLLWPWYGSIVLGVAGVAVAFSAFVMS